MLQGGVGEGQGSARIGDGDRLRAGAQDGVEDAQALVGGATVGDVHRRADGPDRAPLPGDGPELGPRTRHDPPQPAGAVHDAMLDVEFALAVGIVRPLERRDDPSHILRVHMRDDLRDRDRLVGIPSVDLPELERPEDHVRRMVVVEDPDGADPDRLTQSFVVFGHELLEQAGDDSGDPQSSH